MPENLQNDEDQGALLESGGVAPTRYELRLDDALKAAAQAEADELGVDLAEFVRGSIHLRLSWIAAVRAIQAGLDPELLMDTPRLMGALNKLADQQKEHPSR